MLINMGSSSRLQIFPTGQLRLSCGQIVLVQLVAGTKSITRVEVIHPRHRHSDRYRQSVGTYSSQLLCTYDGEDGESHSVLREETESTEETLQAIFALMTDIWQSFFSIERSVKRTENPRSDTNSCPASGAHSGAASDPCSDSLSGPLPRFPEVPLGAVSGRERELFIESFWWLLHRVSGFSFDVPSSDWVRFIGTLDPSIPVSFIPMTMVGGAVLLSVSHARLFRVELEMNEHSHNMRKVSGVTINKGFRQKVDRNIKGGIGRNFNCVCAQRWMDSTYGKYRRRHIRALIF